MRIPTLLLAFSALLVIDAVAASPITAAIPEGKENATFTNVAHPGNRIGYRFHEHTPLVAGEIPEKAHSPDAGAVAELETSFSGRDSVLVKRVALGDKDWAKQTWTFYMVAVDDGVELLWVVETGETGLNEYYGVQQCFRLGGKTNAEWRRTFAETPAFSEYDLWNTAEKDAATKTSLTFVVRSGRWEALPAVLQTVGARTPLGIEEDTIRTSGNIVAMPKVGPYDAEMLAPVDSGLITRTTVDKDWVCGIYWEHTSHVTDHHPADCLHAIVNLGPTPPNTKRAIRGKIYWFKGSLDDLLMHWKRDFAA